MEKKDYFRLQSKYACLEDCLERYRKEFRSLNGAVVPAFLVALLAVVPMAVEQFGIEIPYWTDSLRKCLNALLGEGVA